MTARAVRPRRAPVAAVLLLALALTGCGTPDDAGPATAPDPAGVEVVDEPGAPSSGGVDADGSEAGAPLAVSGTAVGRSDFGSPREATLAALTERLGEPDLETEQQFEQVEGQDDWYERADDEISPRWAYSVFSATCWDGFCVLFGGDAADDLALRGWELSTYTRWTRKPRETGVPEPGVVLADSGLSLGDPWTALHEAYPETEVGWAEGATLGVGGTPWRTVFDGVDGWRISGYADYDHPERVPADAVITRLSAGEGPEPGCC